MTLHIHFDTPPMMSVRMQDLDYETRVLYHHWEETGLDGDWDKFQRSLFNNFQIERHLMGYTEVTEIYEVE